LPQIVAGAYVLGESDGSQSTVEVGGTQFNAMKARGIGDDVRLHERSKALEDRTPRADPAWNKAGKLEADESITRLRKPEGATRFGVGSSVPFHAAASSGEYAVGAETSWKESWSKPAHSWFSSETAQTLVVSEEDWQAHERTLHTLPAKPSAEGLVQASASKPSLFCRQRHGGQRLNQYGR
jgi:hypothetical protein